MQMDKEQYGKARACLVSCMQEGHSWQVAKAQASLQIIVLRHDTLKLIDGAGPDALHTDQNKAEKAGANGKEEEGDA